MEALTGYIRTNYPHPTSGTSSQQDRSDRDAILTVLARRQHKDDHPLDLHGTDLAGANLSNADLSGTNLKGTNLNGADLMKTDLSDADLSSAILQNAHLKKANLRSAKFDKADLQYCDLERIENWRKIKSINVARTFGITNAPNGFQNWASENGAIVDYITDIEWQRRKAEA